MRRDIPRQQFVEPIDGVIRDALEHVVQVGEGLDVVELGGADEGVERRGALSAGIGSGEEIILSAQGDTAQRTFGVVVVDLDAPVVEIAGQGRPAGERVADGLGEFGFDRDLTSDLEQAGFEGVENRPTVSSS